MSTTTLLTAGHGTAGHGVGAVWFDELGHVTIFTQGTSQIVAIASFGLNADCAGAGFGYLVDISGAAAFISSNL